MARIFDTAMLTPDTPLSELDRSNIYNGLDCCITREIYPKLLAELDSTVFETYQLERDLQAPILEMNISGLLVDEHRKMEILMELDDKLQHLHKILNRIMIEGFNYPFTYTGKSLLPSTQQIGRFLYDYIGCPQQFKRNAEGKRVVTADRGALETLLTIPSCRNAWPVINIIVALRDYDKKRQELSKDVDPDHRFRASYNIAGTNTGRLSSSKGDFGTGSNAQNLSSLIRPTFIASKGKIFVVLDLEQADSRNVGAICWEEFYHSHGEAFAGAYLDACESGDLHTLVTKMARPELDWPEDPKLWRKVSEQDYYRGKSYRDISKGLGHGSNYLLTPASAAQKIKGLPVAAATEFQNRYFTAFPCIKAGHIETRRQLLTNNCLFTLFGRRRHFFGRATEDETFRAAVAFKGQGSTTDEINRACVAVHRGGHNWPGFGFRQQVHDSITVVVNEECLDEFVPWFKSTALIPKVLTAGREFVVPTECKVGWNLGNYNYKNPAANPDGLKVWSEHGNRKRMIDPRDSFKL